MSLNPEVLQDQVESENGEERSAEDSGGRSPYLGEEITTTLYLWNPLLAWYLKRKFRKMKEKG